MFPLQSLTEACTTDPDDYWVEVVSQNPVDKTEGVKETDLSTYRMVPRSLYNLWIQDLFIDLQ